MVLKESFQVLLAIFGEEESVNAWTQLLERSVWWCEERACSEVSGCSWLIRIVRYTSGGCGVLKFLQKTSLA